MDQRAIARKDQRPYIQYKSTVKGSHKLWKITKNTYMHGKVMEFEKNPEISRKMEFSEKFDESTSGQKTSCQTLVCPTASFLATGGCVSDS